jgi:hypothetical protein
MMGCEPGGSNSRSTVNRALDQANNDAIPQAVEKTNQGSADALAALMLAGEIKLEVDLAVAAMAPEDVKAAVDDLLAKITVQLDLDKDGKLSPEEMKKEFDARLAQFKLHFKVDKVDRESIEKLIKDHIVAVRDRNKDVFTAHKKELCERFQVKSEKADHDKVAQSRLFDRIVTKCEGLEIPEMKPIEEMRKEVCDRFKDFQDAYIENSENIAAAMDKGEISASVSVNANPVLKASASLPAGIKPLALNFNAILGQIAHRYCEAPKPLNCQVGDKQYKLGENFKQDCNSCTCKEDGQVICSMMGCSVPMPDPAPIKCQVGDKTYKLGENWSDGCHGCSCTEMGAICSMQHCIKP